MLLLYSSQVSGRCAASRVDGRAAACFKGPASHPSRATGGNPKPWITAIHPCIQPPQQRHIQCRTAVELAGGDGGAGHLIAPYSRAHPTATGNIGNNGGAGGGGGGDDGAADGDGEEFLSQQQAEELAAAKGISLPADFIEAAVNGGLRRSVLLNYIALQGTGAAAWLATRSTIVRDRLLTDPNYLFKCLVEVIIDSACVTVAEVRKRGDDFWKEFEFFLSDWAVGLVLDVALVTLITPAAVLGRRGLPKGSKTPNALSRYLSTVPTAVFEASIPGVRQFTLGARAACYVVKGLEYALSGMAAGFVGQGVSNTLMVARRALQGGAKEDDVEVPDLLKTTLVWGMFMGLSSNTRYQIVFGLERLVDSTVGRRRPLVSRYTTVGIRFVNNVIGGENFIDMARWAGVQ